MVLIALLLLMPIITMTASAANTCTITYNANANGDYVTGVPGPKTNITPNTYTNAVDNNIIPVRANHIFLGWSTMDNPEILYQNIDWIYVYKDITLYAIWEDTSIAGNGPYTVGFNYTDRLSYVWPAVIPHGVSIADVYEDFNQWTYTDSSGIWSVKWYKDPARVLFLYDFNEPVTDNFTLYAKWQQMEYTVTYNTNGGTGGPPTKTSVIPNTYTNVDYAVPTKSGSTFLGWATRPTNGTRYKGGDWIWMDKDITLYAIWSDDEWDKENTVSFNYTEMNGWQEGWWPKIPYGQSIYETFGEDYNDPSDYTYTSGGVEYSSQWYTDSARKIPYDFHDPVTSSFTIYAEWIRPDFRITYLDLYGATNSNPSTYINEDLPITLVDPGYRAGYFFDGWVDEYNNPVEEITVAGDLTLYATWEENPAEWVTISFAIASGDTDKGSLSGTTSYRKIINTSTSGVVTAPTATANTGYTHTGWDKAIPATFDADTVIYATWDEEDGDWVTISFAIASGDTDKGSLSGIMSYRRIINTSTSGVVTAPSVTANTGYTHTGWDESIPATFDADTVIYATWDENPDEWVTISFAIASGDTDKGSLSGTTSYRKIINTSTSGVVTAPTATANTGYTHTGWDKAIPATFDADTVIYATWAKDPTQWSTITFTSDPEKGTLDGQTIFEGIKGSSTSGVMAPNPDPIGGYQFTGWDEEIPTAFPNDDLTITAEWEITLSDFQVSPEANRFSISNYVNTTTTIIDENFIADANVIETPGFWIKYGEDDEEIDLIEDHSGDPDWEWVAPEVDTEYTALNVASVVDKDTVMSFITTAYHTGTATDTAAHNNLMKHEPYVSVEYQYHSELDDTYSGDSQKATMAFRPLNGNRALNCDVGRFEVVIPRDYVGIITVTVKPEEDATNSVTFHINVGNLENTVLGTPASSEAATGATGNDAYAKSKFFVDNVCWRVLSHKMGAAGNYNSTGTVDTLVIMEHAYQGADSGVNNDWKFQWGSSGNTYNVSQICSTTLTSIFNDELKWAQNYAVLPVTANANSVTGDRSFTNTLNATITAGYTYTRSSGTQVLNNSANNLYGCFLLSAFDVFNTSSASNNGSPINYGWLNNNTANIRKGAILPDGTDTQLWLRGYGSNADRARSVYSNGTLNETTANSKTTYYGIRPAMILRFPTFKVSPQADRFRISAVPTGSGNANSLITNGNTIRENFAADDGTTVYNVASSYYPTQMTFVTTTGSLFGVDNVNHNPAVVVEYEHEPEPGFLPYDDDTSPAGEMRTGANAAMATGNNRTTVRVGVFHVNIPENYEGWIKVTVGSSHLLDKDVTFTLNVGTLENTVAITPASNTVPTTINAVNDDAFARAKFFVADKCWRVLSKTVGTQAHNGSDVLILAEHIYNTPYRWNDNTNTTSYYNVSEIRNTHLVGIYDNLPWAHDYAMRPNPEPDNGTTHSPNNAWSDRWSDGNYTISSGQPMNETGSSVDGCFMLSFRECFSNYLTNTSVNYGWVVETGQTGNATTNGNIWRRAANREDGSVSRQWLRSAHNRYNVDGINPNGSGFWGIAKDTVDNMGIRPAMILSFPNDCTVTSSDILQGTVTGGSGSYLRGTLVTLTATPEEGYEFSEWQVISGGVTINQVAGTFTMPNNPVEIQAIFKPLLSQVIITVDNDMGTVTVDGDGYYQSSVTLTAIAEPGYKFVSWEFTILPIDADYDTDLDGNPTVTFTMPASDVYVKAVFELE